MTSHTNTLLVYFCLWTCKQLLSACSSWIPTTAWHSSSVGFSVLHFHAALYGFLSRRIMWPIFCFILVLHDVCSLQFHNWAHDCLNNCSKYCESYNLANWFGFEVDRPIIVFVDLSQLNSAFFLAWGKKCSKGFTSFSLNRIAEGNLCSQIRKKVMFYLIIWDDWEHAF